MRLFLLVALLGLSAAGCGGDGPRTCERPSGTYLVHFDNEQGECGVPAPDQTIDWDTEYSSSNGLLLTWSEDGCTLNFERQLVHLILTGTLRWNKEGSKATGVFVLEDPSTDWTGTCTSSVNYTRVD